jgi:hypothetical protein
LGSVFGVSVKIKIAIRILGADCVAIGPVSALSIDTSDWVGVGIVYYSYLYWHSSLSSDSASVSTLWIKNRLVDGLAWTE